MKKHFLLLPLLIGMSPMLMGIFGIDDAIIVMGLMVAAAGMSGYGMYAQGQAQAAQSEYQSRLAKRQAEQARIQQQWAEYNAQISKAETANKKKLKEREIRDIIGKQRAAGGKSGVYGKSLLEVELDTAAQAMTDIELIEWAGEVDYLRALYEGEQYGYGGEASEAHSLMLEREAGAYSALGAVSGGASLLTGLAEAGGYAKRNWPRKQEG